MELPKNLRGLMKFARNILRSKGGEGNLRRDDKKLIIIMLPKK